MQIIRCEDVWGYTLTSFEIATTYESIQVESSCYNIIEIKMQKHTATKILIHNNAE